MRLKPDGDQIIKEAAERGIRRVYHYTLKDNLKSILKTKAVLSRKELKKYNIMPVKLHGWGNTEKSWTFEEYICLGFEPPLGMIKKEKKDIIIFEIDSKVLGLKDTLFSPDNTAREGIELDDLYGWDNYEAFSELFRDDFTDKLKNKLSEILVKERIDISFIKKIIFSKPPSIFERIKLLFKNIRVEVKK